jgi:hypothetical protein
MNFDISNLIAVLEAEVFAGENLQRNLNCQKQAIIAWDVEALLAHVEAREVCLRGLAELESRRIESLAALPLAPTPSDLTQLIAQIPAPEQARLRHLQRRSRKTFVRLWAEDQALQTLKQNLVGHIHEAMNHLAHHGASVYGESGQAASSRCAPGLIYEKA